MVMVVVVVMVVVTDKRSMARELHNIYISLSLSVPSSVLLSSAELSVAAALRRVRHLSLVFTTDGRPVQMAYVPC